MSEPNPQREALVMARAFAEFVAQWHDERADLRGVRSLGTRARASLAAIDAALAAPGGGEIWNEAIEASAKIARDRAWEHETEAERLYAKPGQALSHHDAGVHKMQGATAATINNDILALRRPTPTQDGGDG